MVREVGRGKLVSILAELIETKVTNGRKVFRLDMDLAKNETSIIRYEQFVAGVFQRKHLLRHPKDRIKTFVYKIDLLNFLLETVKKKSTD